MPPSFIRDSRERHPASLIGLRLGAPHLNDTVANIDAFVADIGPWATRGSRDQESYFLLRLVAPRASRTSSKLSSLNLHVHDPFVLFLKAFDATFDHPIRQFCWLIPNHTKHFCNALKDFPYHM